MSADKKGAKMHDLRTTPYTGRIMELTGADHREALILETALRWGFDNNWGSNPGTLDHLGAAEFDRQVRAVFHVFLMDPAEREEIEKLAEAERLIPLAPKPDRRSPAVGDRVRVWFSGNGVVVDDPDDPKMRPYRVRLDRADADTFHNADQIRPEIGGAMPGGPLKEDDDPFPPVEVGATAAAVAESDTPIPDHDCMENAVPYVSDGPLGHGWECGVCGEFLQAG